MAYSTMAMASQHETGKTERCAWAIGAQSRDRKTTYAFIQTYVDQVGLVVIFVTARDSTAQAADITSRKQLTE
jgi:hypothetical protein